MSAGSVETRRSQLAMAAYLRNPEEAEPPAGVEPRRLKIYQDLIYNNIEGFISGGFPVLRSLYKDADWHALVRGFILVHRCRTPYFLEISQEFLRYLMEDHELRSCDPPFMVELAHYEWLELALDVSEEEIPETGIDPDGDLMAGVPVVSPLVMASAYQYPVHRVGPSFRPTEPGEEPTFLLVYRDRDDVVRFMETNAVTVQLLDRLRENSRHSAREVLTGLAHELAAPADTLLTFGAELLGQLAGQSIIVGIRRPDA